MRPLEAQIFLVNGGMMTLTVDYDLYQRLRERCDGKQLINELITDDWGARPTSVRLSGDVPGVGRVDVVIPYS